jgi:hypothetical protein
VAHSAPLGSDAQSGDNAFVSRPGSMPMISGGGKLDLTNNDLVVDYSDPNASPAAAVEALVASAFDPVNQDWNGPGITSSVARDDSNYFLAVAENANLSTPFGDGTTGPLFYGQSVDDTTVLVKFTWRVDLNLDGLVNGDDASVFSGNYAEGQPAIWMTGDVNYDGIYNGDDASIFSGNYNEALTSLPEPGVSVFGIALLGVASRRRRIA